MAKWHTTALLLAGALSGSLVAGGQQPPTFRVEAQAIEVDVFVTDGAGRFVRDLTLDDFELLEDGERQEISAWTLVDLPIDQVWAYASREVTVDTDVATNGAAGRLYVMLLDSPGLQRPPSAMVTREQMFRFTRRVAHRFVDEALGPDDRVAVIHVQGGVGQPLTGNRRLIKEAIDRLQPDMDDVLLAMEGVRLPSGGGPLGGMGVARGSAHERYCNLEKLRNSYQALESTAERLGAITGRRKAILWINGGIPFDPLDECDDDPIQAPILAAWYRDARRAAMRHNVVIYPIDPIGLTADRRADDGRPDRVLKGIAALRAVAEDTGGEAIVNTNNFGAAYERVVRGNSTYYLLAYHPPRHHQDGRFHSIDVRVKRPGLTVRARRGYLAPEPGRGTDKAAALDPGEILSAALQSPIGATELGLRLFVAAFRGAGADSSVLVAGEVHGVSTGGTAAPRVQVAYLTIDTAGRTRSAPPLTLSVVPRGDAAGAADLHFTDRLVLPPGRYELRMVVHQPGGPTGSVVADLEVPDFAREALALSGIVLAATGADSPILYGDARLEAALGMQPTTQRRFAAEQVVTAFAEVYTDARTREQELQVEATLVTGRGETLRRAAAARASGDPGRAAYAAEVPLTNLAAGDYVLALEARAGQRAASRQVPITVEVR